MVSREVMTGFVVAAVLAALPATAQDRQRARSREQSATQEQRTTPERPQRGDNVDRAVPRSTPAPRTEAQRRAEADRRYSAPRSYQPPRVYQEYRAPQDQRRYETPRAYRQWDYDSSRGIARPAYGPRRDYGVYRGYVPRYDRGPAYIIRPRIVTIVPYRPYVYSPSWSLGVFYGADGYYPYGYTPRVYYDPVPGRAYGGLRITDMPRDAQVFADGYYVGIVNDFDGIFQHLNLEAGPHHIEILLPGGYDPPVAFDVYIEPGRTVTYRAGY